MQFRLMSVDSPTYGNIKDEISPTFSSLLAMRSWNDATKLGRYEDTDDSCDVSIPSILSPGLCMN